MVGEPVGGYILRISRDEWLKQVFEKRKYYPGLVRKWSPGMTILLARKTEQGDSFIGYGVIGGIFKPSEASKEEQEYCLANGWKCILSFKELVRFEEPLPLKRTFLKNDKRRGRLFHALPLTLGQVDSVLEAAGRSKG